MLTTQDWLERVRGGAEVGTGLAEAARVAERADEWIAIAAVWAEHGELEMARRCIDTAVDQAEGEHWPCRRAAELLLRLEEREAASAVLGRIEARLTSAERERPARAYQWVLLVECPRSQST